MAVPLANASGEPVSVAAAPSSVAATLWPSPLCDLLAQVLASSERTFEIQSSGEITGYHKVITSKISKTVLWARRNRCGSHVPSVLRRGVG